MFNQPSVTCEAALLVALQNRRLVGSLLPQKKTVQFARTSLSYRPIAALSTGVAMTEGRGPKNANSSPRICAKTRINLGWRSTPVDRAAIGL